MRCRSVPATAPPVSAELRYGAHLHPTYTYPIFARRHVSTEDLQPEIASWADVTNGIYSLPIQTILTAVSMRTVICASVHR